VRRPLEAVIAIEGMLTSEGYVWSRAGVASLLSGSVETRTREDGRLEAVVALSTEATTAVFIDEEHQTVSDALDVTITKGHTDHCAARIIWGDGECSCPGDGTGSPYHTMNPAPKGGSRGCTSADNELTWPEESATTKGST